MIKIRKKKYFWVAVASLIAGTLFTVNGAQAQLFEDVTEQVGLSGIGKSPANWIDVDNDGFVDLYVSGQLWRNIKGQRFERVADTPLKGSGTWADFDNDGFIDMFSWQNGGQLFRNINGKSFEVVKNAIPELPMKVSQGAAWFDWDGDGLLDLYVGGYEIWQKAIYPDVILRSQGDGAFKEVWRQSKKDRIKPARGITAADYDENGTLDIYVSNYRLEKNTLWKNNGSGNLVDVADETKTGGHGMMVNFGNEKRNSYGHTIGSAWGDFDNDGYLDLFVGNFSHPPKYQNRTQFLKNGGREKGFVFEDKSSIAKLKWQESFASPALADFDNDGNLDFFFTTVYKGDHSVLYRNLGNWQFEDVTKNSIIKSERTYQAAWADFDNDGYPDLITNGKLYRNLGAGNNWLKVRVEGNKNNNRSAIGAQVRVKLGDQTLTRQVESSTGQGNQNEMTLLFGLGKYKGKVEIEVRWLDGRRKKYFSRPNRILRAK